jgi:hypothetical protein
VTDGGTVNASNRSFFTPNGVVTIDSGGIVNAPAGLDLRSQTDIFNGTIDVGATGQLDIFGRVSLHSTAARLSGNIILLGSSGRITGSGRISGALTTQPGSEISVGAGEILLVIPQSTATGNIGGKMTLTDGGVIDFGSGAATLGASGRLSGRGTFKSGGLTNNGTISLSGGASDIFGPVTNNSTARVFVTGNSIATFYDNLTNNAVSVFQVSAGSTAVFFGNVTGLSAFTGTGIKDFEGGTSITGGLQTVTGDTIVGGPAALTARSIREHGVTISGRVNMSPNGTSGATSVINELTIDGGAAPIGTLDLNNNALVVDYASGQSSPLPMLRDQTAFAYHGGAWDRPGITSSLADANTHAIGIAERAALAAVPAIFGTVDADAVLIRFTRYGDANLDGLVNLADFNKIATNFGQSGKLWSDGDFNYDGLVNLNDFNKLASNFGLAALAHNPTPQDWSTLAAAVPEPNALLATASFVLALARRRRHAPLRAVRP